MARATTKSDKQKVVDNAAADGTEAVDVASSAPAATDAAEPVVDDAREGVVAEAVGHEVVAAEVKPRPLVFGVEPNPPLQDMNRAASRAYQERKEESVEKAHQYLSRIIGRRRTR